MAFLVTEGNVTQSWDELRALLMEAGKKFDGHVTNGSIEAQIAALESEGVRVAFYLMHRCGAKQLTIPDDVPTKVE